MSASRLAGGGSWSGTNRYGATASGGGGHWSATGQSGGTLGTLRLEALIGAMVTPVEHAATQNGVKLLISTQN